MKILVLFDLARPAVPNEDFSPKVLQEQEDKPTEADVLLSLQRLGHEVEVVAVFDDVASLVDKLKTFVPDVVFNLLESFHGDRAHAPSIAALLDLMQVRYTGAGAEALLLCQDKVLSKKVLTYHRLKVPHFVISNRDRPMKHLRRFVYPAFVKPVREESSDGISQASLAILSGTAQGDQYSVPELTPRHRRACAGNQ